MATVIAMSQGCSTSENLSLALEQKPTTIDELLLNIKSALSNDKLLFNENFYREATVQKFFGASGVTKAYFQTRTPFTRFDAQGPSPFVPDWHVPGSNIAARGLAADITKYTDDGKENGKIKEVRISLTFQSEDAHLISRHVMDLFGYPWTEDRKAEQEMFFAIAREPWNPPAKPQHLWRYELTEHGYRKEVILDFRGGDYLWQMTCSLKAIQ